MNMAEKGKNATTVVYLQPIINIVYRVQESYLFKTVGYLFIVQRKNGKFYCLCAGL